MYFWAALTPTRKWIMWTEYPGEKFEQGKCWMLKLWKESYDKYN